PTERMSAAPPQDRALCVPGLDEAGFVREHDGLNAVSHGELRQYVSDMCLHRCLADEELFCDLRVREAARDQLQHLELAGRQFAQSRRQRSYRSRRAAD